MKFMLGFVLLTRSSGVLKHSMFLNLDIVLSPYGPETLYNPQATFPLLRNLELGVSPL